MNTFPTTWYLTIELDPEKLAKNDTNPNDIYDYANHIATENNLERVNQNTWKVKEHDPKGVLNQCVTLRLLSKEAFIMNHVQDIKYCENITKQSSLIKTYKKVNPNEFVQFGF